MLSTGLDLSRWWYIGVICSILACIGTVLGLLMQKYSHNLDPDVPGNMQRKRKLWWASLVLMIIVPAPLDVLALGLAAQSLLAPLTAVTLLLTIIMAPMFLPEKILPIDIGATVLVCIGAVVSTYFGPHIQTTFDVPALYELYSRPTFIAFQVSVVVAVVVVLLWVLYSPDPYEDPHGRRKREKLTGQVETKYAKKWWQLPHKALPFAHAWVASMTGAEQMVLTKTISELLFLSFDGNNQMVYALTYVIAFLAAAFAAFQIAYLSSGLERFDAIYYLAIYNSMLIVFNITAGGIYFDEFKHTSWDQFLLFCFGTLIVISGVLILIYRPPLHDRDYDYEPIDDEDAEQMKSKKEPETNHSIISASGKSSIDHIE